MKILKCASCGGPLKEIGFGKYICEYCGSFDEIGLTDEENAELGYCGQITLGRITNADRIRAMTDEELEDWYWWMHDIMMWYTDSRSFVHDWLKQEVQDA